MDMQKILQRVPLTADVADLQGIKFFDVARPLDGYLHAIIDFETTGLDTKFDEIIEMGIFLFFEHSSGAITSVAAANWLNEPAKPISEEITQITGITQADVAGKHIDWDEVRDFLAEVDVFAAHNADFDRKFFARYYGEDDRPWYCTSRGGDVNWKRMGYNTSGLELLTYQHGFFYDAHRAVVDCVAVFHLINLHPEILDMVKESLKTSSAKISAISAPIRVKDDLKARGYRWNPDAKVWWIKVLDTAIEKELDFLEELYFNGRNTAGIEFIPSNLKYLGE